MLKVCMNLSLSLSLSEIKFSFGFVVVMVEENDMGFCSSTCTEPRGDFFVGNFTGLGFPVVHSHTTGAHL